MKVCVHCFNDIELKQFIKVNSNETGLCDYCSNDKYSDLLDISELLDFFAEFVNIFKHDSSGKPLVGLIQSDWNLFSGEIECNDILSDILLTLNSPFKPQENVNYIDEIIDCVSYWEVLKEKIKWEKRFITNIDIFEELGWKLILKKTFEWSKFEPLYRGRLHYSGNQKEFGKENMGCPDKNLVPAGRANPQGIPYLYLSKHIVTVLYEIRATYLDDVSIGTFYTKDDNEIILVDFTEDASAFSKVDEIVEYTKSMLLKRYISIDLSKPIRRYDSEIEYIPTQFICEYIRYITDANGILFNSSLHNGGKNIVLFEQEKVECLKVDMHRVSSVDIIAIQI
jgi:RES domain-containing protein